MTQRVLIVQPCVHYYRKPFFLRLSELLLAEDIELTLIAGPLSGKNSAGDARADIPFCTHSARRSLPGGLHWQSGVRAAARNAHLIIAEQAVRALHIYPLLCPRSEHRFAFWGHGLQNSRGLSGKFKAAITKHAHWWFVYTPEGKHSMEQHGIPADAITVCWNSIDTEQIRKARTALSAEDISRLRTELFGHDEGLRVGIFCGRLKKNKRIDAVLDTAEQIHAALPGFRMLLVGDGDRRTDVERFVQKHPWCVWVGPKYGSECVPYFASADIALNPGATGLSILDAYASGIPYATAEDNVHGPELAYLKPDVTGILARSVDQDYADKIICVLKDSSRLQSMKDAAAREGLIYSIERMASEFAAGIMACLAQ